MATKKEVAAQDAAIVKENVKEAIKGISGGSSLRSKTSTWFECKVRYQKTMDDGSEKTVTELYVVEALSFTEEEAKIIDEMSAYVSGEFKVSNINRVGYKEVFFSDVCEDDLWFKAKLAFITINEKTDKEKRTIVTYLIQAKCIERAKRYLDEVMGSTMIDYEVKNLGETNILDVFEYYAKDNSKDKSENKKSETK